MIKLIRSFALYAMIGLVLVSCNFRPTATPIPEVIQPIEPPSQIVSIELSVQANPSIYDHLDQEITYTYIIKNSGNTSLGPAQFTVSDGQISLEPFNCDSPDKTLAPNETVTCTKVYKITQDDLNEASLTNSATASVGGAGPSPAVSAKIDKNAAPTSLLTLATSANPLTYDHLDQEITYTYVITNSGTGNLGPTQFTVSDGQISPEPFNCGEADKTLAPNETATCSKVYKITQGDLNEASLTNSATASGGGAGPSPSVSAKIDKGGNIVQPTNPTNLVSGSTIQHTVVRGEWLWQVARCYGAAPNNVIRANPQLPIPSQLLQGTILTIPNIGSAGTIYGTPCVGLYAVQSGDTWNSIAQKYNADLVVLQRANAGVLSNQLIVPCNSAGGPAAPCNSTGNPTVPPAQTKSLTLTTAANPLTYDHVDQEITYTYIIKNSGNTSLGPTQFTVSDGQISLEPFNCDSPDKTLAPNETATCSKVYKLTQDDLNEASLTSFATASGGGVGPSPSVSTTINKNTVTTSLTLTTAANPLTYDHVDQEITYTYVIINSGTTSLGPTQFTVSDGLISLEPFNCGDPNKTLAPNEMLSCAKVYKLTQDDLNETSLTNSATASGGGAGPSPSASTKIDKK